MNIGDVITGLASEFPDVTVTKIRYLESYGLLEPERSPAGYRLFSVDDVARLTWILRQQRDHFLPLKVIRSMLLEGVDLADSAPEESVDVRPFRESGRTDNLGSCLLYPSHAADDTSRLAPGVRTPITIQITQDNKTASSYIRYV